MELKPSTYNIFAPSCDGSRSIVYNTLTGRLALIGDSAKEILQDSATFYDIDCIKVTKDVLSEMIEAGFIIEANRNETVELEAEYGLLQQDSSVFSLCIAPTYTCNLACPYCYEEGRGSSGKIMDRAMQDQIVEFAKLAYDSQPYNRIEVQWYGGEPMLAPNAVEDISKGLMDFCEEKGLGYNSSMISNATRIDPEEAAMLKRSCVSEVIVTIDGPENEHNKRRPTRDGSNSYEAVLAGIGNLIRECIDVVAMMNTDKVNDPLFDELNEQFKVRFGMGVTRMKLNDYYGTFGHGHFCEPGFSLMDHSEFAQLQCRRFCEEKHSLDEFAFLMRPIPLFCKGQAERYYCIDAMGDVYKCDGHMGRASHVLFNLDDVLRSGCIPSDLAPLYPFNDAACKACSLLPLCKGTCEWERKCCSDHPCHPLKYTAKDYLQGWVGAISPNADSTEELTILSVS